MYFVFVPLAHVDYFDRTYALTEPPLHGDQVYEQTKVSLRGFYFYGVLRVTNTAPSALFPAAEIHSVTTFGEQHAATVVTRPGGRDDAPHVDMLSELSTHLPDIIASQLLEHLDLIAQVSNRAIDFIITNKRIVAPTGTKKRLRVVLGSPPPGYSTIRETETLFDIPVSDRGYTIGIPTPSVDVGVIVHNILNEPVAQIVGDTIYLLLAVHPSSFESLSDNEGIFKFALIRAWNTYYTESLERETVSRIQNAEDFATYTLNFTDELMGILSEQIQADKDINRAQILLREAMAQKRKLVTRERTFVGLMRQVDYVQGWEQLQNCPYFDFATTTSDGRVHYFTKPLTLKDEAGIERFLGRFGIRIYGTETVTVWSLDYPHPGDIPHPHISAAGGVCLGNVTESLWQLTLEYKEAEAVILVMRLLAEGYDRNIAEHPIEEWPTIETYNQRKQRNEQVTSASYAEPASDSPRNRFGCGLGCQLHDLVTGQGGSD